MRLIFAGTPQFAVFTLHELLRCGHHIELVLTQPDRPSGRGLSDTESPVKRAALAADIAVQQPQTLKDPDLQQRLSRLPVDAWVVAAYGLILPPLILHAPRLGCLNVHASLLPRWRGAAPIQRAIMAGDRETGISIMRMDEGLDTGPVVLQRAIPIESTDTAGSLHDRLGALGAQLVGEALAAMADGPLEAKAQPESGACYAAKLSREEALIDWARPALDIERAVRALDPAPGAYTRYQGQILKVWHVVLRRSNSPHPPGVILAVEPDGIEVSCGDGVVALTELQRSGGRRMSAAQLIRGFKLQPGTRFGP